MNENVNKSIKDKSAELRKKIKKEKNFDIQGLILDDDFSNVYGRCCENILGYRKVPLGVSHNPILLNNIPFYIPICTFEGALVASMCRGIKLINACGGVNGFVENNGITRSFALEFQNFELAKVFYFWLKDAKNKEMLKIAGNENSRFCKIINIESKNIFGRVVYIKVSAFTGDAMGMNMITKACDQIAKKIYELFPETSLVTLSANICTDKKWSIENYANGRGRKVVLNILIKEKKLREVMKIGIDDLIKTYHYKINVGGSIVLGGFNCQAANYVAATFLAFNQDLGHVLESSNCIIEMNRLNSDTLEVSLLMPSLIVGTVGGGTHLEPANSLFNQFRNLNQNDSNKNYDDLSNSSNYLAMVVASAVLAGELSAISALTNNTLMEAHLRLNRRN